MSIVYITYPSGAKRVSSVEGFSLAGDKHAYKCEICGAIWQSKNIDSRNTFPTSDPRCDSCDHELDNFKRICECEPIV